jgi:hypothetical protein
MDVSSYTGSDGLSLFSTVDGTVLLVLVVLEEVVEEFVLRMWLFPLERAKRELGVAEMLMCAGLLPGVQFT